MISPNEAYLMPHETLVSAKRTSEAPSSKPPSRTCRAIKPAPIRMRAQFDVEPRGDFRVVHADVLVELSGLEADLVFRDVPEAFGFAEGCGAASAKLLAPGECFIPPRTTAHVPTSAGALLGVELRDGELAPLGRVVPIAPLSAGIASIETSFEVPAAIGVSFSWVGSDPRSATEILLGGDIRFLRGVVGRLMFRTESPTGSASRGLNMKDVTLLKPGQVIHFPEQFVPVAGEAMDLARIRYTFGGVPAGATRAPRHSKG